MATVASRRFALAAAAVPAAAIGANVASYALLLSAAHLMSAAEYGTLSSLLGLLLISTVPTLALQTVAARRAATATADAPVDVLHGMARGTVLIGTGATLVLVAASPAIALFLHLHSVLGVVLVALTIPATSLLGTAMGVAQGRRAFRRLALLIVLTIGGRSLGGLAGLLVRPSTTATLVGVLAGLTLAAGAVAASENGVERHRAALRVPVQDGIVSETLHAAHAHGLFLFVTSLDVLLARHVLSPSLAGVYAVGSVITRAALWLPQSVVLLLFASLAQAHHGLAARRAATVVGGLGAATVIVTALLSPLVVSVVGGSKYHALDDTAWLFALLGALLALVQLAVQAGLAQRRVRRAALLWFTIAADVIAALTTSAHATPTRLVTILVAVTAVSAVGAVFLTTRQSVAPDGQGGGA